MLISIVKKYWILGSLVIAMVPNSFLSPQVLAQSKTLVQPQPQILSQLTAIDYNNRGFVKIESGDYQGAIADFNQAIKLQPDGSPLLCVITHAYGFMESFHSEPFTVIFSRLVITMNHFPHS